MPSINSPNAWNPVRPKGRAVVLNRRARLAMGLHFASLPGTEGGFRTDNGGSWDDFNHLVGSWEDGATATCYHQPSVFGLPTEPGATPSRHTWSENGTNRYDNANDQGFMSAAVLVRMDDNQNATDQTIFKKRSGNQLATDIGWEFITGPGNTWSFRICDGVVQARVNSTTVQALEANLIRFDLLVATCAPSGANTLLNLWVNGKREASAAVNSKALNNNQPIRFFGNNNLGEFCMCYIGMAAQWDRVLADAEIQKLTADPFALWRHPDNDETMASLFVPGGGIPGGDCCCCCGSIASIF